MVPSLLGTQTPGKPELPDVDELELLLDELEDDESCPPEALLPLVPLDAPLLPLELPGSPGTTQRPSALH